MLVTAANMIMPIGLYVCGVGHKRAIRDRAIGHSSNISMLERERTAAWAAGFSISVQCAQCAQCESSATN